MSVGLWLQLNNGTRYNLEDLGNLKESSVGMNSKLKKLIKIFDLDGQNGVEIKNSKGKNEWNSVFKELIDAAKGDNVLTEIEFEEYIAKKQAEKKITDIKFTQEDLNDLLDLAQEPLEEKKFEDARVWTKGGQIQQAIRLDGNGIPTAYFYKKTDRGYEVTTQKIQEYKDVENNDVEKSIVTTFVVTNIDEKGNFDPQDIIAKQVFNSELNKKELNNEYIITRYNNGIITSVEVFDKDEILKSTSRFIYKDGKVIKLEKKEVEIEETDKDGNETTKKEIIETKFVADSVDEEGKLQGITKKITRHSDGNATIITFTGEQQTILKVKNMTPYFEYKESDIISETTNKTEPDDEKTEEVKTDNTELQTILEYMLYPGASELKYDAQTIKTLFESLGKENGEYEKLGEDPPTYAKRRKDGSISQTIRLNDSSAAIEYGTALKSTHSGREYVITFQEKGNDKNKYYHFNPDGTFKYVVITDDKQLNVQNILYPNGEMDIIETQDGKQAGKCHMKKGDDNNYHLVSQRGYEWDENGRIKSTVTLYTDLAEVPLKNKKVIALNDGTMYYYSNAKSDKEGEYSVLNEVRTATSVPILNEKNEIVGYQPISTMTADNNGRVKNTTFYTREQLAKELEVGQHYDYSKINNELRATAANNIIQTLYNAIYMLEASKQGKSFMDLSVWIDKIGESVDEAIARLKGMKEQAEMMLLTVHNSNEELDSLDNNEHLNDELTFATIYENLTGNAWDDKEKDKYQKFDNNISKIGENLSSVFNEYKKNGTLSEKTKALFATYSKDKEFDETKFNDFIKQAEAARENAVYSELHKYLTGKDWEGEEWNKNPDITKKSQELLKLADEYRKNNNTLTDDIKTQIAKILGKKDLSDEKIERYLNTSINVPLTGTALGYELYTQNSKELLKMSEMQIAINKINSNQGNKEDIAFVLDIVATAGEFKLISLGIGAAGKLLTSSVRLMSKVEKVGKAVNLTQKLLESERFAGTVRFIKQANISAMNFVSYDVMREAGRQMYNDEELDTGKLEEAAIHGAEMGYAMPIVSSSMRYLGKGISKALKLNYKADRTIIENEIGAYKEKCFKYGKQPEVQEINRIRQELMSGHSFKHNTGRVVTGYFGEALHFGIAGFGVQMFDSAEMREQIKAARIGNPTLEKLSDKDIDNMSKTDMMRAMLKMQGYDTEGLSDIELYAKYAGVDYINQLQNIGQLKLGDYIVGAFVTKGKVPAGIKGARTEKLEKELILNENGKWCLKSGPKKELSDADVLNMTEHAQMFDALDSRLQNRFNKYLKEPMSAENFATLIQGGKVSKKAMKAASDIGMTVQPKDGKYEVTTSNGKTVTVPDLETVGKIYAKEAKNHNFAGKEAMSDREFIAILQGKESVDELPDDVYDLGMTIQFVDGKYKVTTKSGGEAIVKDVEKVLEIYTSEQNKYIQEHAQELYEKYIDNKAEKYIQDHQIKPEAQEYVRALFRLQAGLPTKERVNEGAGVNEGIDAQSAKERVTPSSPKKGKVLEGGILDSELTEVAPFATPGGVWNSIIEPVPEKGKFMALYGYDKNSGYDIYKDANGNIVQKVIYSNRADNKIRCVEKYEFDNNGREIKCEEFDENGDFCGLKTKEYDLNGNLLKEEYNSDDYSYVKEYKYDNNNNKIADIERDPEGKEKYSCKYEYDSQNKLTKKTKYNEGILYKITTYEPDGTEKTYNAKNDSMTIKSPDGKYETIWNYKENQTPEPVGVYSKDIAELSSVEDFVKLFSSFGYFGENIEHIKYLSEPQAKTMKQILELADKNLNATEFNHFLGVVKNIKPEDLKIFLDALTEEATLENLIDAPTGNKYSYIAKYPNEDIGNRLIYLMKLREECHNPILQNVDNLFDMVEIKDEDLALLNLRDKNGNYYINTNTFNKDLSQVKDILDKFSDYCTADTLGTLTDICNRYFKDYIQRNFGYNDSSTLVKIYANYITYIINNNPNTKPEELGLEILYIIADDIAETYKPEDENSQSENLKPLPLNHTGVIPAIRTQSKTEYNRDLGFYNYLKDYIKDKDTEKLKLFITNVNKYTPIEQSIYTKGKEAELEKKRQNEIKKALYGKNIENVRQDIRVTLETVQDSHIRELVEQKLNEIDNSGATNDKKIKQYEEVQELIDICNASSGVYTTLDNSHQSIPYYKEFINFVKEHKSGAIKEITQNYSVFRRTLQEFVSEMSDKFPDASKILSKAYDSVFKSQYSRVRSDFEQELRIHNLREYCKNNKGELADYLYTEFYVKNVKVPDNIKQQCLDINKKYGVKIFLPENVTDTRVLNFVDKEFEAWRTAGKDEVKYPPCLDFLRAKDDYFDKTRAYGQGVAGGLSEAYDSGAISINGFSLRAVMHALRHETTHTNDKKRLINFPDGVIAQKEVTKWNGTKKVVLDLDNCMFVDEFRAAGIPDWHIGYAYNNPMEFIAVASEGDMSKYSQKMKDFLVEMGMPKWVLDIPKVIKKEFTHPTSLHNKVVNAGVKGGKETSRSLEVIEGVGNFLEDYKATGNNYEIVDTVDKNGNQIKLLRFHNNIVDGGNYNYAILTSDGKLLQDGLHTDISDSDMQKVLDNYGVKIEELNFTNVKGKTRRELSSQAGMSIDFGLSKIIGGAIGTLIQKYKSAKLIEKVAEKTGIKEPPSLDILDNFDETQPEPEEYYEKFRELSSTNKAQQQVANYLDYLLQSIPEDTTQSEVQVVNVEQNNYMPTGSQYINYEKNYLLPNGTIIAVKHNSRGKMVQDPATGRFSIVDEYPDINFFIKDINGKTHILPAMTEKNIKKAKRILSYLETQQPLSREESDIKQAELLNKKSQTLHQETDVSAAGERANIRTNFVNKIKADAKSELSTIKLAETKLKLKGSMTLDDGTDLFYDKTSKMFKAFYHSDVYRSNSIEKLFEGIQIARAAADIEKKMTNENSIVNFGENTIIRKLGTDNYELVSKSNGSEDIIIQGVTITAVLNKLYNGVNENIDIKANSNYSKPYESAVKYPAYKFITGRFGNGALYNLVRESKDFRQEVTDALKITEQKILEQDPNFREGNYSDYVDPTEDRFTSILPDGTIISVNSPTKDIATYLFIIKPDGTQLNIYTKNPEEMKLANRIINYARLNSPVNDRTVFQISKKVASGMSVNDAISQLTSNKPGAGVNAGAGVNHGKEALRPTAPLDEKWAGVNKGVNEGGNDVSAQIRSDRKTQTPEIGVKETPVEDTAAHEMATEKPKKNEVSSVEDELFLEEDYEDPAMIEQRVKQEQINYLKANYNFTEMTISHLNVSELSELQKFVHSLTHKLTKYQNGVKNTDFDFENILNRTIFEIEHFDRAKLSESAKTSALQVLFGNPKYKNLIKLFNGEKYQEIGEYKIKNNKDHAIATKDGDIYTDKLEKAGFNKTILRDLDNDSLKCLYYIVEKLDNAEYLHSKNIEGDYLDIKTELNDLSENVRAIAIEKLKTAPEYSVFRWNDKMNLFTEKSDTPQVQATSKDRSVNRTKENGIGFEVNKPKSAQAGSSEVHMSPAHVSYDGTAQHKETSRQSSVSSRISDPSKDINIEQKLSVFKNSQGENIFDKKILETIKRDFNEQEQRLLKDIIDKFIEKYNAVTEDEIEMADANPYDVITRDLYGILKSATSEDLPIIKELMEFESNSESDYREFAFDEPDNTDSILPIFLGADHETLLIMKRLADISKEPGTSDLLKNINNLRDIARTMQGKYSLDEIAEIFRMKDENGNPLVGLQTYEDYKNKSFSQIPLGITPERLQSTRQLLVQRYGNEPMIETILSNIKNTSDKLVLEKALTIKNNLNQYIFDLNSICAITSFLTEKPQFRERLEKIIDEISNCNLSPIFNKNFTNILNVIDDETVYNIFIRLIRKCDKLVLSTGILGNIAENIQNAQDKTQYISRLLNILRQSGRTTDDTAIARLMSCILDEKSGNIVDNCLTQKIYKPSDMIEFILLYANKRYVNSKLEEFIIEQCIKNNISTQDTGVLTDLLLYDMQNETNQSGFALNMLKLKANDGKNRFSMVGINSILEKLPQPPTQADMDMVYNYAKSNQNATITQIISHAKGKQVEVRESLENPFGENSKYKSYMDRIKNTSVWMKTLDEVEQANLHAYLYKLVQDAPNRFERLVDSGYFELCSEGKINIYTSLMKNIGTNKFFSKSYLEDVKRIYKGEPLVKHYSEGMELDNLAKVTPDGEVVSVGEQLYVNDSGKMVELKMSEKTFERLFPLEQRFNTQQGAIGNCWLVSDFDNFMDMPVGRAKLYQLFEETDNGGITITFPPKQREQIGLAGERTIINICKEFKVPFPYGAPLKTQKQLSGCDGLKMLEQAYSFKRGETPNEDITLDEMSVLTDVDEQIKRLDGGFSEEFICDILGYTKIKIGDKILDISGNVVGERMRIHSLNQKSVNKAIEKIKECANNPNIFLHASTIHITSDSSEKELNIAQSLYSNHAYSIKGFDEKEGKVYYTNPHDSKCILEMDVYEFLKYIDDIIYVRIK